MKKIYLDYAASTPTHPIALKEMRPFFGKKYGNPSSIYHAFGQETQTALGKARIKIAKILNAAPDEIIFTSCATESNNLALKGVAEAYFRNYNKLGEIIISSIEHHSVLEPAEHLEENGWILKKLKVNKFGIMDLKHLEELLNKNTALVSIMYANNEVGAIEPMQEIVKIIKKKNPDVFVHTDAVQAVQQLSLDTKKLGVDLLSLTGHKFYAPKGAGLLYAKRGTKIVAQQDGGGQENKLRGGTENTASIVGMAKALELARADMAKEIKRLSALRDKLIKGILKNIPAVELTGPAKNRLAHIASFVFRDAEGEAILLKLNEKGIAATSGSACASDQLEPSHVLLAMGYPAEVAHGSLRLSLGKYTTEKEIDYVIKILPEIVKDLRKMSPLAPLEVLNK